MDKLVMGLAPVFAAGFAAQQALEMCNYVVNRMKVNKKITMGLLSLLIGFLLSFGGGIRTLGPLGATTPDMVDAFVTGWIISAGTEGINSIMKFLGYAKDKKKAEANE